MDKGAEITPFTRYSLSPATSTLELASSASKLGFLVTKAITPAEEFLPNSVPCGPRSTSTRSRSPRSLKNDPCWANTTPSMTVDTLGSIPAANTSVPIPRMRMELSRSSLPVLKVTLGISSLRSAIPSALICSSSAPLTTETASGTSCAFSVRFCAVTITSSRGVSAALTSDPTAQQPKYCSEA